MCKILSFCACVGVLALTACVSTPASRIQENPAVFNALPKQEQLMVESGQIQEGMTPAAVYLAWGGPSAVAEGKLNGQSALRWIYSTLQPVITPPPAFWANPFWGPGFYRAYYPYYNDITYVPVNTGYVLFINGKVQSWERRQ